eukprot:COSAG03_NODE_76_length_14245_cov_10.406122_8_plen_149_part_00
MLLKTPIPKTTKHGRRMLCGQLWVWSMDRSVCSAAGGAQRSRWRSLDCVSIGSEQACNYQFCHTVLLSAPLFCYQNRIRTEITLNEPDHTCTRGYRSLIVTIIMAHLRSVDPLAAHADLRVPRPSQPLPQLVQQSQCLSLPAVGVSLL